MIPVYPFKCGDEECTDPLKATAAQANLLVPVVGHLMDDIGDRLKICGETIDAAKAKVIKYLKFRITKQRNCLQKIIDKLELVIDNRLTEQQVLLNIVAPGITDLLNGAPDQPQTTQVSGSKPTPPVGGSGGAPLPGATQPEGSSTWQVTEQPAQFVSAASDAGTAKPAKAEPFNSTLSPGEQLPESASVSLPVSQQSQPPDQNIPPPGNGADNGDVWQGKPSGGGILSTLNGTAAAVKPPSSTAKLPTDVQMVCIVQCPLPEEIQATNSAQEMAQPQYTLPDNAFPEPEYADWEALWEFLGNPFG